MTSRQTTPNKEELKQSAILQEMIREEICANAGSISFEQYMWMCLYTPKLGYYTARQEIFSETGDFITSSEHGNHYAQAFASHIHALTLFDKKTTIIEIGAGNGIFAHDLIDSLIKTGDTPLRYIIVEISAALKDKQRKALQKYLDREDIEIQWLDKLEQPIDCGIVIANEVIDALPVHLISVQDTNIHERCVTWDEDQGFRYCQMPLSNELATLAQNRLPTEILSNKDREYVTEINTALNAFMRETAAYLNKGVMFFVDYGYPRQEYYLAQRNMGTLICHYQHTAHDNPLQWPGLQDISCNVDFTALAEAGVQAELELNCYCTQAQFLLASDYFKSLQIDANSSDAVVESSQLKNLVMPNAMGERFQAMAFTKNITLANTQFTLRDLTYRL